VDIVFHYPPDLLALLIDTIPRLCKGKKDVFLFFKGAGLEAHYTADLEARFSADKDSVGKWEIARTVLTRLNERGEPALRERREVLKRVEQFTDFSTCWPNDQLIARGLVAEIQKLRGLKDHVTQIQHEREAERREHRAAAEAQVKAVRERKEQLQSAKDELFALFKETNAWVRGKKLEAALNRVFKVSDILIREAFTLRGDEGQGIVEQIDGVVEIDGQLYLVEMKWWDTAIGPGETAQHQVRVFNRGHARGIFISASGYSEAAILSCRESLHRAPFVLCELVEIVRTLDADRPLIEMFRTKIRAAIIDKQPLFRIP